jgi:hypothetical protein
VYLVSSKVISKFFVVRQYRVVETYRGNLKHYRAVCCTMCCMDNCQYFVAV